MSGTPIATMVTALTVARLHNLGNYEHVRYEVTVELPDGAKASEVLADVSEILADLKPSRVTAFAVQRAKERLAKPLAEGDEEEKRYDARARAENQEVLDRHAKESARLDRARAALDDLGGAQRYTDAKNSWDDEY